MTQNRGAVTAEDQFSSLPGDLLFDIIIKRLPAEAIRMCRCVCRTWRSFITKNLGVITRDSVRDRDFMTSKGSEIHLYSLDGRIDGLIEPKRLLVEHRAFSCKNLAGYSNGLACFLEYHRIPYFWSPNAEYNIFLWNPYINKVKILKSFGDICWRVALGFGFVHETGDYKVIKLEYDTSIPRTLGKVEIYSLISDSWKKISCPTTNYVTKEHHDHFPSAFVRGCVHWIAWIGQPEHTVILCFNMMEEEFHEISMPPLEDGICVRRVSTFRDSLLLFAREGRRVEVWAMQDYGIAESWSRLYRFEWWIDNNFEIMDCGKILKIVSSDPKKFIYYDPTTEEEIVVQEGPHHTIPSLVNGENSPVSIPIPIPSLVIED